MKRLHAMKQKKTAVAYAGMVSRLILAADLEGHIPRASMMYTVTVYTYSVEAGMTDCI